MSSPGGARDGTLVRGLHHAGLVVSDLDRALDFYGRHLGAELDFRLDGLTGQDVAELNGLPEIDFDLAFVTIAGGARLELLQYRVPQGRHEPGETYDVGAGHVALEVSDVRLAVEQLRDAGVSVEGGPLVIADGPAAGWVIANFRDPDGNRIELVQIDSRSRI